MIQTSNTHFNRIKSYYIISTNYKIRIIKKNIFPDDYREKAL